MNVNGIGAAGHLDLYGTGGIEKSVMERNFAEIGRAHV